MKHTKWIALLLTAALSCSLLACSSQEAATTPTETVQTEAAASTEGTISDVTSIDGTFVPDEDATESSGSEEGSPIEYEVTYPVTLTDQAGREVIIEAEPSTVVSGYYISTSLLIALDCQDRLVGVEAKADKRNLYQLSAPQLAELPSVGTAKEFDLEQCAALTPDLVVLPIKLQNVVASLEELGIPVLLVNPEDQELLVEAINLLGEAVNQQKKAQQLLNFSTEHLSAIKAFLKNAEQPGVYLSSNSSLLSTAGSAMYQDTLITNAGGRNVAEDLTDSYWSEISYEQLLTWDPDYIILAADAEYTVESVLADEALSSCSAVQNGQVYQLPNDIEAWDSPVPSSVLGTLWLASILHSDLYTTGEYEACVIDYYETFYGFTPSL